MRRWSQHTLFPTSCPQVGGCWWLPVLDSTRGQNKDPRTKTWGEGSASRGEEGEKYTISNAGVGSSAPPPFRITLVCIGAMGGLIQRHERREHDRTRTREAGSWDIARLLRRKEERIIAGAAPHIACLADQSEARQDIWQSRRGLGCVRGLVFFDLHLGNRHGHVATSWQERN